MLNGRTEWKRKIDSEVDKRGTLLWTIPSYYTRIAEHFSLRDLNSSIKNFLKDERVVFFQYIRDMHDTPFWFMKSTHEGIDPFYFTTIS